MGSSLSQITNFRLLFEGVDKRSILGRAATKSGPTQNLPLGGAQSASNCSGTAMKPFEPQINSILGPHYLTVKSRQA